MSFLPGILPPAWSGLKNACQLRNHEFPDLPLAANIAGLIMSPPMPVSALAMANHNALTFSGTRPL
jgi:hypothetical protein